MNARSTPYLRVDVARLERNIARAAGLAAEAGILLRPHAKTHKCVEIARLQRDAGATGLTVATVGEAEVFARHGFTDLFIAYPVWLDRDRTTRLRDLAGGGLRLAIGVDSVESAARAGRLLGGAGVDVVVEVDSGHHRSGVSVDEACRVAETALRAGLPVRGIFTFPGHAYSPAARAQAAVDEVQALRAATRALREAGVDPETVSGGSSPTFGLSDLSALTEYRPGVYVFGDAQQWELGAIEPDDIALTCRATVVSRSGDRVVLDCGSKVLGADRPAWASGFGRLPDLPEARITLLSEHHAVVELPADRAPRLGAEVDVVPNHSCNAVNLVDVLYADDGESLRPWRVAARGHLT